VNFYISLEKYREKAISLEQYNRSSKKLGMIRFFDFQDGGRPPSWIFKTEIFNIRTLQKHVLHQHANFGDGDRSYGCRNIAIFHIFSGENVKIHGKIAFNMAQLCQS